MLKIDYDRMDWWSYGGEMRDEGEMKRARESALRMIRRNKLTLEEIAEDTDLPLSEVEKLAGARRT